MKPETVFTVHDVIKAECNLEHLTCLHCQFVGEVVFNQYIGNGCCQVWRNGSLTTTPKDPSTPTPTHSLSVPPKPTPTPKGIKMSILLWIVIAEIVVIWAALNLVRASK